jgi:glycosyltransferase involved in cell wall biosynthesis
MFHPLLEALGLLLVPPGLQERVVFAHHQRPMPLILAQTLAAQGTIVTLRAEFKTVSNKGTGHLLVLMAWSPEVQKQYRWHRFGPEWEWLPANKESARRFLRSLDVFLYPIGHRVKESWGRAVVEAMLTGAVPVVPARHQFEKLLVHGESGFICGDYRKWKAAVRALHADYPLRMKVNRQASAHAREHLCKPEEHRRRWVEALSFG